MPQHNFTSLRDMLDAWEGDDGMLLELRASLEPGRKDARIYWLGQALQDLSRVIAEECLDIAHRMSRS